jgi:phosphoribosylglycinamide formyltransferase 1
MKNLAVFASGGGTNFQAMIDDGIDENVTIALLVCDKKDAYAIKRAKDAGIDTFVFDAKDYEKKSDFETEILAKLKEKKIDFIALAGYMRLIGDVLLSAYEGKIVNIHPSLLPAFKGIGAIEQAIEHGAKVMGVSIHYVDSGMDTGKIIAQSAFEVRADMSKAKIEDRVHKIEHTLYPQVLRKLLCDTVVR